MCFAAGRAWLGGFSGCLWPYIYVMQSILKIDTRKKLPTLTCTMFFTRINTLTNSPTIKSSMRWSTRQRAMMVGVCLRFTAPHNTPQIKKGKTPTLHFITDSKHIQAPLNTHLKKTLTPPPIKNFHYNAYPPLK